jgi:hypothetical protein
MKLTPIGKNIIFIFLNDVYLNGFVPNSGGQIVIAGQNMENNNGPKWGKVFLVGPDVDPEIKVGEFILVEPLQWTPGFVFDEVKFWKTDSTKVMATQSEAPDTSY